MYGYKNYLLKHLVGQDADRMKRMFGNQYSRLWSEFSYKDKSYTLEQIADDILELAPFGDRRHALLLKFVEKQRNISLWSKTHYRFTKLHRGDLKRILQKRFNKYKVQKQKELEPILREQQRLEAETLENKKEIAVNEFDIELTQYIDDNNTPKDDRRNLSLQEAHRLLIEEYAAQSLMGVVQQLRSHPVRQEETFDEVADRIKSVYLKKYDFISYQELDARADKTKRFFYKGKDLYPKK